ncbi:MAG: nucleotide sugar dehydrogenase [Hyphomicrobiales bacterium]|nr:nucleotide sugar dehydrogenase [Hyphomicrobiales bacterium]
MLLDSASPAAAATNDADEIKEHIAVIGLGYVGLPVANAFAKRCAHVVGFDISQARIDALKAGHDWTGEISEREMAASTVKYSTDAAALAGSTFFVVTVPTPVDDEHRPNLSPLRGACRVIGPHLTPGSVVVFESTVYPGATEEVCGPELESASGLVCGKDFKLGYSPERINPGDRVHTLRSVIKIVAGQDADTLERVSSVYSSIVDAGVYEAKSIKVAEAAKVIENTQRDLNIALMNELAIVFDRLGVRTEDVLEAAGTKWNFLPFKPGLVGGHCIGVDPYYLTAKAEAVGYHPQVILAGRRINDGVGRFVAQRVIQLMVSAGTNLGSARVGLLGLTFKENVPDLRNSRVPDIVDELTTFGISPLIHDPICDPRAVEHELGLELVSVERFRELDALVLAVIHDDYLKAPTELFGMLRTGGVFVDIKSVMEPSSLPRDVKYWSL